jgi:hypothetical protein
METKLREYENFHIVLWIMKDTCWLMDWKLAGVIMIVPTVVAAFHITWLSRKNIANLLHNLAVSHWISANAVWMIGEFFYDDTLRPFSAIFFSIGFIFLAVYYFGVLPRKKPGNQKRS